MAPTHGIEIDPGRHGDADVLQHGLGEGGTVRGQGADIDVEIEGAVRGKDRGEARHRQLVQQQRAIGGVAGLDLLQLVDAIEGAECRDLRDRRRRDVEILCQPLDGPHQSLRHHQPADAPAGHAEIFREAVYDDGRLPVGNRRDRRFVIFKPMVDLIGDQPEPTPPAGIGELAEPRAHGHGAGRVVGTGKKQSGRLFTGKALEVAGIRHPPRRGTGLDQHRLRTERLEDMAVAGVAGRRQQHGIAGVEHGEKGEHESGR